MHTKPEFSISDTECSNLVLYVSSGMIWVVLFFMSGIIIFYLTIYYGDY